MGGGAGEAKGHGWHAAGSWESRTLPGDGEHWGVLAWGEVGTRGGGGGAGRGRGGGGGKPTSEEPSGGGLAGEGVGDDEGARTGNVSWAKTGIHLHGRREWQLL